MMSSSTPLHDVSVIETPEQIEIGLPLAGLGSRAFAYLIDCMWQAVVICAALMFLIGSLNLEHDLLHRDPNGYYTLGGLAGVLASLVIFFVNFGYGAFFETAWRGQTPGKRAMHLRVVRDGGYPIDGRTALLRNVLRVVDIMPGSYLVGLLTILIGRGGKRLGDYAAGTVVVSERPVDHDVASDVAPRQHPVLSRDAMYILQEFMARRDHLPETTRDRLAERLATALARHLKKPEADNPEAFLESLWHERRG